MLASFLTAEWRKLAMVNYVASPDLLKPYVPKHTELDLWNGVCYVSLVGFLFDNVRLKGIPIPFHTSFEEVNLRFYVRYCDEQGNWKRGTTFIKEIVPKPAVSWIANLVYHEPYVTMPMRHRWQSADNQLTVSYEWKEPKWNCFEVVADNVAVEMLLGSKEEFITEHYFGYTKVNDKKTFEYEVKHPRWQQYKVVNHQIDANFGEVYGNDFEFLNHQKPISVMLAIGSEISVENKKQIT